MNPWKRVGGGSPGEVLVGSFRKLTTLPIITNVGFTQETAEAMLASGDADAIAFGKLFISNPDLVERFAAHERGEDAPLNKWDDSTFYARPGMTREQGYTDYPTRNQANRSGLVNK
jgi:2,4-dienoyl-CoA reductase-like NADH-dependent reductase (Old Yellow Enzyme family)